MDALAKNRLEQTHIYSEPPAGTIEFTYASGSRPLEGYTIKRGLGAGGFGEAYFAVSDGGKEVAIKLVRRHLDVELRGISQCLNLKHPNLVPVYDVRTTPKGESWVIMEYMAGDSLQERIEKLNGPLNLEEALHWLEGIGAAIDFLHDNGIVHRDLKPGNVFSEGELVKVGDYGLSKFISNSRRSGQTQSIGTVHYMAPEISTGNYGRGIDIYAAGVIAFEMLSAHLPFDGETAGEILMKHLTAEPDFSRVDPKFHGVFAKALAKAPADRFQSVAELCSELRSLVAGGSSTQANVTSPAPTPLFGTPVTPATPSKPVNRAGIARPVISAKARELKTSLPPIPGTFAAKRREVSDALWSIFLAGVLSAVLSVVGMAAQSFLSESAPKLAEYLALCVIGGFSSAGILIIARVWDHVKPRESVRRLNMLIFGMGVGLAALAGDIWLDNRVPQSVAFETLSQGNLDLDLLEKASPVILLYMSLGAGMFAIPDWAHLACRERRKSFSMWSAIWPACVALILGTALFADRSPFWFGYLVFAVALTVQWLAPHRGETMTKLRLKPLP